MFVEKQLLKQSTDVLFALVAEMQRGEVLTYRQITELTGLDRDEASWNTVQRKLRKRVLRELGIATIAIENHGYRLLTNEEQIAACASHRNKKKNQQVLKAIAEIGNADASELPLQLQKLKSAQLDRLAEERKANRENARSISSVEYNSYVQRPSLSDMVINDSG